jgi:hypothetical protein
VAWPAPDAPAPPGALGAALPTRWGPAGEARYPAAFVPAMRALEQEGESGLAERARSERDH